MLYHLSEINHNNEVFVPRVPKSLCETKNEDNIHKRVCFSTTISGAYRAIQFSNGEWMDLYVHVPIKKNIKYRRPTSDQVFDVNFTNEVWVSRKVKLKCIGKIRAMYDERRNRYFGQYRPNVIVKWLEKY